MDNLVASVFLMYLDSVKPLNEGCINESTSLNWSFIATFTELTLATVAKSLTIYRPLSRLPQ